MPIANFTFHIEIYMVNVYLRTCHKCQDMDVHSPIAHYMELYIQMYQDYLHISFQLGVCRLLTFEKLSEHRTCHKHLHISEYRDVHSARVYYKAECISKYQDFGNKVHCQCDYIQEGATNQYVFLGNKTYFFSLNRTRTTRFITELLTSMLAFSRRITVVTISITCFGAQVAIVSVWMASFRADMATCKANSTRFITSSIFNQKSFRLAITVFFSGCC